MTVLEDYFVQKAGEIYDHPLLRLVDEAAKRGDVKRIVVEVLHPRDVFGFKPAKICLHLFNDSGQDLQPHQKEEWEDILNLALVRRGIRALSVDNEKVRCALGLRAALQAAENRFGDGYFNAVLVHHMGHSPFARLPAVETILPYLHRNGIDPSFRTYEECREMIDAAIRGRAMELVESLHYDIPEAEEILAAAVAQYLDDRFSVTNRRIMGLLTNGENP